MTVRPFPVNHLRRRPTLPQNLVIGAGGTDLAVLDGDGFDERRHTISGDLGVMQDDVGRHEGLLSMLNVLSQRHDRAIPAPSCYLCAGAGSGTMYSGNFVAGAPCTMV